MRTTNDHKLGANKKTVHSNLKKARKEKETILQNQQIKKIQSDPEVRNFKNKNFGVITTRKCTQTKKTLAKRSLYKQFLIARMIIKYNATYRTVYNALRNI